jgi:hypothetical protein
MALIRLSISSSLRQCRLRKKLRKVSGRALILVGILLAELKSPASAAPESPEPIAPPAST